MCEESISMDELRGLRKEWIAARDDYRRALCTLIFVRKGRVITAQDFADARADYVQARVVLKAAQSEYFPKARLVRRVASWRGAGN